MGLPFFQLIQRSEAIAGEVEDLIHRRSQVSRKRRVEKRGNLTREVTIKIKFKIKIKIKKGQSSVLEENVYQGVLSCLGSLRQVASGTYVTEWSF
ncbi:MAG: hypothetical protein EB056_07045 [Verrucomicrobia bacterium]|nr:hypothetical protein [Verrucomicrobiota bacterium]